MILFSSRALEAALAKGELGSWEKAKYAIIPSVLGALGGIRFVVQPVFGAPTPFEVGLVGSVSMIASALLAYHGIKRCYEANERFGGGAFLERFVILLLPPFLVLGVLAFVATAGVLILGAAMRAQFPESVVWAGVATHLMDPLLVWGIYAWLNRSFERFGKLVQTT